MWVIKLTPNKTFGFGTFDTGKQQRSRLSEKEVTST